jgi:hypothetical protein
LHTTHSLCWGMGYFQIVPSEPAHIRFWVNEKQGTVFQISCFVMPQLGGGYLIFMRRFMCFRNFGIYPTNFLKSLDS